jgi:hypothetical protein
MSSFSLGDDVTRIVLPRDFFFFLWQVIKTDRIYDFIAILVLRCSGLTTVVFSCEVTISAAFPGDKV